MQRRLTIAIIGTAMAAILLVGVGVLVFSRIGAERDARDLVSNQLAAVAEIADTSRGADRLGGAVGRLADAFGVRSVQLGRLSPDGEILLRAPDDRRGRGLPVPLEPDSIARLRAGEDVILVESGRVRGFRPLGDLRFPNADEAVIVIDADIAPVPPQARAWFVLSAALVIVGALVVALVLARRFTAPIRSATRTTERIAGGDLAARMSIHGTDELASLGESINRMATELERNRAAERQFLLSISHDLRTPLTAIGGWAEALRDGAADDTSRTGAILADQAARLDRLVGDLLDLARLESRTFRFESRRVDVGSVVEEIVADRSTDDLRVDVGVESGLFVDADPDRLAQIVENLLHNAVKFASSTIDVRATRRAEDDEIEITVADDGPGIHADDLPHVFERLYVTQQRPRRAEVSSGLGLAIVRQLATAMSGTVEARSTIGQGTTMIVRLPAAPPSP